MEKQECPCESCLPGFFRLSEFLNSLPDFSQQTPEQLNTRVEQLECIIFSPVVTAEQEKEAIKAAWEITLVYEALRKLGSPHDQIVPEKRTVINTSLGEFMRLMRIEHRITLFSSLYWKL